MNFYKCLNKQEFRNGDFLIVPVRFEDRLKIMVWRNHQISLLRQKELLTEEVQTKYFQQVVLKNFEEDQPNQLLFSFFWKNEFIGYGGLVHINWDARHSEISFLLNPEYQKEYFRLFTSFLHLIEELATSIPLEKIYTYGYDTADDRFRPLIICGYQLDAFLHEHVSIDGRKFAVRIYSKFIGNGKSE